MDNPQNTIDKDTLYGKFQDMEDKKAALALKAAHKALDIADDDMHIQANQTHNHTGLGTKGVVAIAMAAGLPALLAVTLLLAPKTEPPKESDKPTATPKGAVSNGHSKTIIKDQEYDAIYEVQQPDGSWKQVKRERLTPSK